MLANLNLLAIFDALYELRSVTQTARRLNLTQSAVSHALRRLRETVDDPLFVRSGGTLQPTLRAHDMAAPIREGLARLREATVPTQFDPAVARRTFTLAATSYLCALLIPELIAAARARAPGITIRVVPIYSDLVVRLDEGSIDLALGAFSRLPSRLVIEPLFRDDLVWITAADNPIAGLGTSHAELLAMPHLALDPIRTITPHRTQGQDLFEADLPAEQTVPSDLAGSDATPAIVYDAMTAMGVVARTDLVALVPRRLAQIEQTRRGIAMLDTAPTTAGIDLVMISRARSFPDAAHDWLRALLLELGGAGAGRAE